MCASESCFVNSLISILDWFASVCIGFVFLSFIHLILLSFLLQYALMCQIVRLYVCMTVYDMFISWLIHQPPETGYVPEYALQFQL